jgi:hypothetical protein
MTTLRRDQVWNPRWLSSALLRFATWLKFIDVSEVFAAPIIRAMSRLQAAHLNNPEDSHLRARRRENRTSTVYVNDSNR